MNAHRMSKAGVVHLVVTDRDIAHLPWAGHGKTRCGVTHRLEWPKTDEPVTCARCIALTAPHPDSHYPIATSRLGWPVDDRRCA